MSTISSLASSIIQNAVNQVSGIGPSPNRNTATVSASGTRVSLGSNASPAPTTYNALGKMSGTQVKQLEKTVTTQVDHTISQMFSGLQTSATRNPPTSLYSILAGASAPLGSPGAGSLLSMLPNSNGTIGG
ncbi:MAG TPA: hypothetical protein VJ961_06505 [Mariprofundaceae bacterium]|nr:hypothetical protein [Mariprofundaceae bacterium]